MFDDPRAWFLVIIRGPARWTVYRRLVNGHMVLLSKMNQRKESTYYGQASIDSKVHFPIIILQALTVSALAASLGLLVSLFNLWFLELRILVTAPPERRCSGIPCDYLWENMNAGNSSLEPMLRFNSWLWWARYIFLSNNPWEVLNGEMILLITEFHNL